MTEAIQADNISVSYAGLEVLNGINECLQPGETITIIGPSGSGKSTLLKVLAGLETPSTGTVYYGSRNYYKIPEAIQMEIQFDTGFVFQEAALLANMNIYDNIALPLVYHAKFPPEEIKEKVIAQLAEFHLERWMYLRPAQLSIGKRKLAALARAMISEPGILFLDDPTANTDNTSAKQIENLLIKRSKEPTYITIMVSSNIHLARTVSDRLMIMYNGEIIAADKTMTVMASKNKLVQQIIKSVAIQDDTLAVPAI
jgi:ABC-type transporter Mla maintaining outer membrane lipid asymmetry ATPase subunit MlaF